MKIQLKVTKDSPIPAYRHYEIQRNGEQVGTFSKGADGRWNVQIVRDRSQAWSEFNRTAYSHSNYHAMIRLIACYLQGDMDRVTHLARGIWINPCPTPEIVA
jgi:hypothetical protein